jgi:hypothetical protein
MNTPEDVSDDRLAEIIASGFIACDDWPVLAEDVKAALRELQRHRAENNELDAKRYRWLRDDAGPELCVVHARSLTPMYDNNLDHAIDSAMSNASEEGR